MRARGLLVRLWVGALLVASIGACESLLTDPAPASPDVIVSFAIEDAASGGVAEAFERVNRAYLLFTRPDSAQRDTIVRVTNENGAARARLLLDTKERVAALGVYAELRAGTVTLFKGQRVVRIQLGTATSAEIALSPVPALVKPDRQLLTLQNVGDTAHLASAVLFASRDTIPGISGTWSSEDPDVVVVTPGGIALGRHVGQTRLVLRFGTITDTINARVLSER